MGNLYIVPARAQLWSGLSALFTVRLHHPWCPTDLALSLVLASLGDSSEPPTVRLDLTGPLLGVSLAKISSLDL